MELRFLNKRKTNNLFRKSYYK